MRQECLFSLLFDIELEILDSAIETIKRNKRHKYWKKVKLLKFTDDTLFI